MKWGVWSGVVILVLLGWGVGRSAETKPSEPAQPAPPSVVVINIVMDAETRCDKAYDPPVVTAKVGTTVEWINKDYETHTLISSTGGDPCKPKEAPPGDRVIDVGQLPPRGEYKKTFEKPGVYRYMCHLPFHRMSGKIVVVP